MVGLGGLEPPTSRLSGARSSQLSYRPLGAKASANPTASFILKELSRFAQSFKTKQQARSFYGLWSETIDLVDLTARRLLASPAPPKSEPDARSP